KTPGFYSGIKRNGLKRYFYFSNPAVAIHAGSHIPDGVPVQREGTYTGVKCIMASSIEVGFKTVTGTTRVKRIKNYNQAIIGRHSLAMSDYRCGNQMWLAVIHT